MSPDSPLQCRRLPCRLAAEEVSVRLGCNTHDIPILARAGLLKPLGSPAPNSAKHFAAVEIERKMAYERWSTRMTNVIYNHWRDRKKPDSSPPT